MFLSPCCLLFLQLRPFPMNIDVKIGEYLKFAHLSLLQSSIRLRRAQKPMEMGWKILITFILVLGNRCSKRYVTCYFRLPLLCKWDLRSSGILCSIEWQSRIEVSGLPIGPVFKGREVLLVKSQAVYINMNTSPCFTSCSYNAPC